MCLRLIAGHSFVCEPTLSWTCVHDHAGVCVEQKKSLRSDEFLRSSQLSSSIFALGVACFLALARKRCFSRFDGDRSWTRLLLLGGRISQSTRRFSSSSNTSIHVR